MRSKTHPRCPRENATCQEADRSMACTSCKYLRARWVCTFSTVKGTRDLEDLEWQSVPSDLESCSGFNFCDSNLLSHCCFARTRDTSAPFSSRIPSARRPFNAVPCSSYLGQRVTGKGIQRWQKPLEFKQQEEEQCQICTYHKNDDHNHNNPIPLTWRW